MSSTSTTFPSRRAASSTSADAPLPQPSTSVSASASRATSAVFTLFEGNYHLGAAALFNSLYAAGFRGPCYAGVRGDAPQWTTRRADGSHGFETADGFSVHIIPLQSEHHLTNVKPLIFQRLWANECANIPALFYFDPDIVVKRSWTYFEAWVQHGVALVQDVNSTMPPDHPTRCAWADFAAGAGYQVRRPVAHYYNGGFVGARREHLPFFDAWADLLRHAESRGAAALGAFSQRNDAPPFIRFPDQDTLNMAVMCTDVPVSTVGNAEMDFTAGGTLMSHAMGRPKPWARSYLQRAASGIAPANADKLFWQAAGVGPIHAFAPSILRRQRRRLALASALGRLYRRT
ncbi:hypothetical protein K0B96_06985 [Horticoccus luteus]|uniref:Uncharacterized protein n=1 Tax=Horticoccus luteus TaxID=2862869 RepID=A0A8F9XMS0_9BACT|nr:hypothetical protein [Horticoccus luteus]QYM80349.1 hypothetical protein K0B96_06985 [Horticoccus luteus]